MLLVLAFAFTAIFNGNGLSVDCAGDELTVLQLLHSGHAILIHPVCGDLQQGKSLVLTEPQRALWAFASLGPLLLKRNIAFWSLVGPGPCNSGVIMVVNHPFKAW